MATSKTTVRVVEKNEGTKIEWRQNGNKLIFGDDDLSIRCDTRQRDLPNTVDVCVNKDGELVTGTGAGCYYVAQIEISAIEYIDKEVEDPESESGTGWQRERVPFDMKDVTLVLWSVDHLTPATSAAGE